MKKVAIVTATRAEYGLLSPVIRKLREYESSDFKVDLIGVEFYSKAYSQTASSVPYWESLHIHLHKPGIHTQP